jgi:hypothetical protein
MRLVRNGAVVDMHHTSIKLESEVEGLLHVVGDDAGGQPIGRVVGDLQRLDV